MGNNFTSFSPLERGRFCPRFSRGNKISRVLMLTLLIIFSQFLSAQIGNDMLGARSAALGGYNATLFDVWSTNNNQGGLGFLEEMTGGAYYENRFLLSETSYKAGAFVMPVKTGALGLSVSSFGYELYNETKAGLSYGQRFGDKFSVGVQLNYLNTKLTQGYGSKTAVTGAIGAIAKLSKEFTLGVHVYNPSRSKLTNDNNERIPTIMKLGVEYKFSDKVMFVVSSEKDVDFEARVNAGIEYHITEMFYLRGGISTNPTQYAFGAGMQLKHFKVDLSSSFHQTLGITPAISIVYSKKKHAEKGIAKPGVF